MSVTIYTKDGCPFCAKAVKSFQDRGVPFEEVNLSENPSRLAEMEKLSGGRKVPVVVENGRVTVGFNGGG